MACGDWPKARRVVGGFCPTVTVTIQRMIQGGWVTMAADKSIHLTTSGREAAQSVIRGICSQSYYWPRSFGVPWSQLHEEAVESSIPYQRRRRRGGSGGR
jgi:Mn-dependent DtxR family transcriptional regulator